MVAPREKEFIYCNMMYTAAAYLVERTSELPFADFLDKHFFQPLAMHSTNLQPGSVIAKGLGSRLATGYFWDQKAGEYQAIPCRDAPEALGAGRMITSANDYIKWVKAMINHEGPVTSELYGGLTRKRIAQDAPDSSEEESEESEEPFLFYAAGWQVHEYNGHTVISHDGSDNGFKATNFFLPELKFGAVILGNSNRAKDVIKTITFKLIDWAIQAPQSGSAGFMTLLESEHESNWQDEDEDGDENDYIADLEEDLREELCSSGEKASPQTLPLNNYIGLYWNPGYRGIKVVVQDGVLFVDASDRSMGFTLTFEHVCGQTKYIARLTPKLEPESMPTKAEFRFSGGVAVELGLELEEELDKYIWFKRVDVQGKRVSDEL